MDFLTNLDSLSIHAPTRGATTDITSDFVEIYTFNPRSYKRSDIHADSLESHHGDFQSTLLQEERRFMKE